MQYVTLKICLPNTIETLSNLQIYSSPRSQHAINGELVKIKYQLQLWSQQKHLPENIARALYDN